jgi:hypothetical protein
MTSCPASLEWSPVLSAKRQKAAEAVLGKAVVARLVGYAFYLLGVNREDAAKRVDIPVNTFLSFLTRMGDIGLDGLRDRRGGADGPGEPEPPRLELARREDGSTALLFLPDGQELSVPAGHAAQERVVLLSFAACGLLDVGRVARHLGLSPSHARSLLRKLAAGDAPDVLDKRPGQRQGYRMTDALKGEMIAQWAANAAVGKACSSPALREDLHGRCGISLPGRTIRYHLGKLGLSRKGKALAEMIAGAKKNS